MCTSPESFSFVEVWSTLKIIRFFIQKVDSINHCYIILRTYLSQFVLSHRNVIDRPDDMKVSRLFDLLHITFCSSYCFHVLVNLFFKIAVQSYNSKECCKLQSIIPPLHLYHLLCLILCIDMVFVSNSGDGGLCI